MDPYETQSRYDVILYDYNESDQSTHSSSYNTLKRLQTIHSGSDGRYYDIQLKFQNAFLNTMNLCIGCCILLYWGYHGNVRNEIKNVLKMYRHEL